MDRRLVSWLKSRDGLEFGACAESGTRLMPLNATAAHEDMKIMKDTKTPRSVAGRACESPGEF
jgi:hypothetical protein